MGGELRFVSLEGEKTKVIFLINIAKMVIYSKPHFFGRMHTESYANY